MRNWIIVFAIVGIWILIKAIKAAIPIAIAIIIAVLIWALFFHH